MLFVMFYIWQNKKDYNMGFVANNGFILFFMLTKHYSYANLFFILNATVIKSY